MGKSDVKELFAEYFGECFTVQARSELNWPVVIDDVIIKLTKAVVTLKDRRDELRLFDICEHLIFDLVDQSRWCPVTVVCMDKYRQVSIAKQPEQRTRTARGSGERVVSALTSESMRLPGHVWRNSFCNNRSFKQSVVRHFTALLAALLPERMAEREVPAHHRIVIDHEHLRTGQPVIDVCAPGPLTPADASLAKELWNDLGEFDVAHVHHLRSPRLQALVEGTADGAFLVDSVDTDILLINANAMALHGYPAQPVRVRTTLPPRVKLPHQERLEAGREQFVVDCGMIRAGICEVLGDRFEDFVMVYVAAGCDFNPAGIQGKSNLTCLKHFMSFVRDNPAAGFDEWFAHMMHTRERDSRKSAPKTERGRTAQCKLRKQIQFSNEIIARCRWVASQYWLRSWDGGCATPIGNGFEYADQAHRICEYTEDLPGR